LENNKVCFHSSQTSKAQKGNIKLPPQSESTTPIHQNKFTNNDKTLIYSHMEKIKNMFQNIIEQITKLTNRIAALECNNEPEK